MGAVRVKYDKTNERDRERESCNTSRVHNTTELEELIYLKNDYFTSGDDDDGCVCGWGLSQLIALLQMSRARAN